MEPSAILRTNFLLAVTLGTVFVNLGVFWVLGTGPSWPLAPLGLVYAAYMALWGTWAARTNQGGVWKAWTLVLPSAGLYLGLFWASGFSLAEAFGGDLGPLLGFLVCLFQGFFAAFWAGQSAGRARLSGMIDGVEEGKDLEDRAREISETADYTKEQHRRLTTALGFTGSGATVLGSVSPYGRDWLTGVLLGAFLVFCLLVWVWLQTCRREREALTWGHRFTRAERTFPVGWVLVLGGLSAAGSWVATSLVGPLDFRWSPAGWVKPVDHGQATPQVFVNPTPGSRLPFFDLVNGIALFLTSLFVNYLLLAFGLGALGLAVFLVWPLVRQIHSGGWRGLGSRWKAAVLAQVRGIWGSLKALVKWRPGKKRAKDGESVSGAREWIRSLFGGPGLGARQPYPGVVEAFLKLVRWAEPVASYRSGETTHAFLDRLAASVPGKTRDLGTVRDLLDRELFGPQVLDRRDRILFLSLVEKLLASRLG